MKTCFQGALLTLKAPERLLQKDTKNILYPFQFSLQYYPVNITYTKNSDERTISYFETNNLFVKEKQQNLIIAVWGFRHVLKQIFLYPSQFFTPLLSVAIRFNFFRQKERFLWKTKTLFLGFRHFST